MKDEKWLALEFVGLALTIFDSASTTYLIENGIAGEANPIMAVLIREVGLAPAMILRCVVGMLLLILLYELRDKAKLAKPGLVIAVVALSAVALVHLYGLITLT